MGMEDEDQGEGEQDGHGEGVARPEIQRRSGHGGVGPTITPDRWLSFLIPNLGCTCLALPSSSSSQVFAS